VICKLGELKILRRIPSRTRESNFFFCEIRKDNQQDVFRAEKNWAYLDLAEEKKGRGRRTIRTDLGRRS
jgi:hypothetical protein